MSERVFYIYIYKHFFFSLHATCSDGYLVMKIQRKNSDGPKASAATMYLPLMKTQTSIRTPEWLKLQMLACYSQAVPALKRSLSFAVVKQGMVFKILLI